MPRRLMLCRTSVAGLLACTEGHARARCECALPCAVNFSFRPRLLAHARVLMVQDKNESTRPDTEAQHRSESWGTLSRACAKRGPSVPGNCVGSGSDFSCC